MAAHPGNLLLSRGYKPGTEPPREHTPLECEQYSRNRQIPPANTVVPTQRRRKQALL